MPWSRLDDGFPRHMKVRRLSDAAFRLHVSGICWCSEHLTDGKILAADLGDVSTIKRPSKVVSELVEHGLWKPITEGWTIHDYLNYNPTAEKVKAERAKAAERQRRLREGRNGVTNGVTSPDVTDVVTGTPPPARPVLGCSPVSLPPPPSSVVSDEAVEEAILEIRTLRREWGPAAIRKALTDPEVQTRPWDVARMAMILVARDADSKQPGRLKQDGPWWSQAAKVLHPIAQIGEPCGECSPMRRIENPDGSDAGPCPTCHPSRRTA